MYKLGDLVMYGAHGVCEIKNIEQRRIDRKNIEYYVLSPVYNATSCFYIPTNNEKALSKLCPILSEGELKALLLQQADCADVWIDEENARKQRLKEVLSQANRVELIQWVKTMHLHRSLLLENGKKFHQIDESFLKDAEKILTTEFAVVLHIPENAVRGYVHQLIMQN